MIAAIKTHRASLLRRFAGAHGGVSAVEFALVLPVLILLYLGGTELTQAITVDRKLTAATSSIADLVSRAAMIEDEEMAGIFRAAEAILYPFSDNDATIVVSSIRIDDKGVAKVDWSDGYNKAKRAKGSVVTLPPGVAENNMTIIMAEGTYAYSPRFGSALTGTVNLTDTFYLRPRVTDSVSRP